MPSIDHLRAKAGRADQAAAAVASLQRENALLKSGVDLESPRGELFARGYDGDLTTEALTAEAQKYGVPIVGQAATETQVLEEAYAPTGTAQRMSLSDGSPADTGENKDPRQLANDHFDRRMADGSTREAAAADHLNMLANAAMRGDKRVINP